MKHKMAAGPFVVMEVLEEAILDKVDNAGSTYFREPLDVRLGSIDEDGDFLTFLYDSRRFEHAE